MMPNVFWANAVPDADVTTDLTIHGSPLTIADGVGYYEETWGDAPLLDSVYTWYWGHGRVGPYSITWFDAVDPAMTEHVSGYVAKEGQVLGISCAPRALSVRPWGANSEYPPVASTGLMQGLYARYQLDDGSILGVNITTGTVVFYSAGFSARMLGTLEGGIEGLNETFRGVALYELLKLGGSPVCSFCDTETYSSSYFVSN
jgi:hypothetical protein